MAIVKRCIAVLLLLGGLGLFLAPDIYSLWLEHANKQIVEEFQADHPQNARKASDNAPLDADSDTGSIISDDELYEQAQQYNERIFGERQAGITDAWSFTQSPFALQLEDDLFGYVEIPAMDVTLPLYLGATNHNMSRGAVVLGETSVPIGGNNTNSVIAGHRGYQGAPFFREIERLQVGDEVRVTNLGETLTYQVVELAVIQPDNSDAIRIQAGKDMLTLVTCHPYRSGGKYRYLVYCERVRNESEQSQTAVSGHTQTQERSFKGEVPFESSESDIHSEQRLRIGGAVVIGVLLLLAVLFQSRKKSR